MSRQALAAEHTGAKNRPVGWTRPRAAVPRPHDPTHPAPHPMKRYRQLSTQALWSTWPRQRLLTTLTDCSMLRRPPCLTTPRPKDAGIMAIPNVSQELTSLCFDRRHFALLTLQATRRAFMGG